MADFLSVLDAQRQQLAIEDDLVQSDTAVVTGLVALYKALLAVGAALPPARCVGAATVSSR